jgi:hypothetical protein
MWALLIVGGGGAGDLMDLGSQAAGLGFGGCWVWDRGIHCSHDLEKRGGAIEGPTMVVVWLAA